MNAAGGMKPSHRYRAPLDLRQNVVHLFDTRNAFKRDARVEQTPGNKLYARILSGKNVLAHDESPDRVIDRCVIVVPLIDRELE